MPKITSRKYMYRDHDTDEALETPPVQNTWYEVFHDYDVRLLKMTIRQANDEVAAKNVEVRWTIDGTAYLVAFSAASGTTYWIFRENVPSAVGTAGLWWIASIVNATTYADKRGLDFKVEVRITGVLGTNQTLRGLATRETLVPT